MCSLSGIITTKWTPTIQKVNRKILIASADRGEHATGIAGILHNGKTVYSKLPVSPYLFITHDIFFAHAEKVGLRMAIQHTRFATQGEPEINSNNHPHRSTDQKKYFAHNGVTGLTSPEIEATCKTKCDSERILRAFELYGIIEGTRKSIEAYGNVAYLYLDTASKLIYYYSDGASPLSLHRVETTDGAQALLWTSTDAIFDNAVKGEMVRRIKKVEVKKYTIYTADMNLKAKTHQTYKVKYAAPKPIDRKSIIDYYHDYTDGYRSPSLFRKEKKDDIEIERAIREQVRRYEGAIDDDESSDEWPRYDRNGLAKIGNE